MAAIDWILNETDDRLIELYKYIAVQVYEQLS